MKRFEKFTGLTVVSALLGCGMAFAQDQRDNQRNDQQNYHRDDQQTSQRNDYHNDNHGDGQNSDHHDNRTYVQHREWRSGHRMNHDDWARGEQVDWRAHHLRGPAPWL